MDPRLLALCTTYGVFLRREALALGYHDQTIAKLVRSGHWVRVRHGAYTFGEIWARADKAERYRLRVRAAMRQANTEVVSSHTSAVAMHRGPLWGLDLGNAHLTRVDQRTGRKEAGVQQHRGEIVDGDVVEIGVHKVMSPTRAVLEVTTVAGVDAGVCVADHFLNRGATTFEQLRGPLRAHGALARDPPDRPRAPARQPALGVGRGDPRPPALLPRGAAQAGAAGGGLRRERDDDRPGRHGVAGARGVPGVRRPGEVPQAPAAG
ncbi:type IV toxin-antitoxin system AbiEi family antitoxin domain-containing protein [Nocardioides sp. TF02-7]|uniref:type IV toxin-antitoxin system AbiEi family antitoxin domain-containing protein n=1 Tax=Nocardioides sp. TF02-7 TaxID=2917724 RepID=UPI001F056289|nr:type IV toxin-antitoxin system AbiEi family antitoxin domain-containing protein [Nocardioides sp. TF02-7]UMG91171.1 type IV toxin-antitoxin system AbiEi family antitoxin domain-containing protein [Nocardioides sp. TF02-7]